MVNKLIIVLALFISVNAATAQKSKVQAAWRSLSDYEETLKEGKPNYDYLNKAKEAIDMALLHEDTKKQAKTHAYKLRISYMQYQQRLDAEIEKLAATISDKNERAMTAYGNVPLNDLNAANEALNQIKELDPKYLHAIQEGLMKGATALDEEELKFALAAQQTKMEAGNIAAGKYNAKKYSEAAEYFYKTAMMNSLLFRTMDTANFYNACVSAAKAGDNAMALDYNKKMIDARIAAPYNYEAISGIQLSRGDTASALETLKKGRASFPSDAGLITQETNLFLATGKQQEALNNLKISVEKDPKNALYYFIIGNIYDNMANPKDKNGRDLEKPSNFNELFTNAETNYKKAIAINPENRDYLYNAYYNLGAMYNNHGGSMVNRKVEKITDLTKYQKENEAAAQEYYKLAIPNLEQALNIRPDDKVTMSALRKLYLLTGNESKAREMSDRLKK